MHTQTQINMRLFVFPNLSSTQVLDLPCDDCGEEAYKRYYIIENQNCEYMQDLFRLNVTVPYVVLLLWTVAIAIICFRRNKLLVDKANVFLAVSSATVFATAWAVYNILTFVGKSSNRKCLIFQQNVYVIFLLALYVSNCLWTIFCLNIHVSQLALEQLGIRKMQEKTVEDFYKVGQPFLGFATLAAASFVTRFGLELHFLIVQRLSNT